jgi:hypothetical protein
MVAALIVVAWPIILVVIGRLWRSGLISDRLAVLSALFLMPALLTVAFLAAGTNVLFAVLLTAFLAGGMALMYRPMLSMMGGVREASLVATDPMAGLPRSAQVAIIVVVAVPQLPLITVFVAFAVTHRI